VQLAITLCEHTSAPNEVVLSAYGDKERWMLHEWREIGERVVFPAMAINYPAAGGEHTFITRG
jgi:hypothetical protein